MKNSADFLPIMNKIHWTIKFQDVIQRQTDVIPLPLFWIQMYIKHPNKLTPQSVVLLKKLKASEPVKKFPAFYGTWKFIAVLTRAHHCTLS
jgi:hypothetical protein